MKTIKDDLAAKIDQADRHSQRAFAAVAAQVGPTHRGQLLKQIAFAALHAHAVNLVDVLLERGRSASLQLKPYEFVIKLTRLVGNRTEDREISFEFGLNFAEVVIRFSGRLEPKRWAPQSTLDIDGLSNEAGRLIDEALAFLLGMIDGPQP